MDAAAKQSAAHWTLGGLPPCLRVSGPANKKDDAGTVGRGVFVTTVVPFSRLSMRKAGNRSSCDRRCWGIPVAVGGPQHSGERAAMFAPGSKGRVLTITGKK